MKKYLLLSVFLVIASIQAMEQKSAPCSESSSKPRASEVLKQLINQFHRAVVDGNEALVDEFLNTYPRLVNIPNEGGFTPLHMAAYGCYARESGGMQKLQTMMKKLLAAGADKMRTNKERISAEDFIVRGCMLLLQQPDEELSVTLLDATDRVVKILKDDDERLKAYVAAEITSRQTTTACSQSSAPIEHERKETKNGVNPREKMIKDFEQQRARFKREYFADIDVWALITRADAADVKRLKELALEAVEENFEFDAPDWSEADLIRCMQDLLNELTLMRQRLRQDTEDAKRALEPHEQEIAWMRSMAVLQGQESAR